MMCKGSSKPEVSGCQYWGVIVGIYMLAAVQNLPGIWNNLSGYTISYFHFRGNEETGATSSWVESLNTMAWSAGLVCCERIARSVGVRGTMAIGSLIFTSSMSLCYLTVQHSFVLFNLTFAVLCGFGYGICHGTQIKLASMWVPPRFIGVAVCALPASCQVVNAILNMLITWFINPNNGKADSNVLGMNLFSKPELLDRIPYTFLLLGGISLVLSSISFILVRRKPTHDNSDGKPFIDNGESSCESVPETFDNSTVGYNKIENSTTFGTLVLSDAHDGELKMPVSVLSTPRTNQNSLLLTESTIISEKTYLKIDDKDLEKSITKSNTIVIEYQKINHVLYDDITPQEAVKSSVFYAAFTLVGCTDISYIVNNTYAKVFAMSFYPDDQFFTIMTVAVNVASALAVVASGLVTDRCNLKTTLVVLMSTLAVLASFYYVSVLISKWFYFVWCVMYTSGVSSAYALQAVCAIRFFGKTYCTTIYGMLASAAYLTNISMPFLIQFILSSLGFFALYTVLAVFMIIGLVVVVTGLPKVSRV